MSKPIKVRYDFTACVIDGVVARRVQTLGSTTDFSEEKLLELANQGSAEVIDTKEVSVTIETNDWGTTNTMALIAELYNVQGAGQDDPGYSPDGIVGNNTYLIMEDSFDGKAVDVTAPLAENIVSGGSSTNYLKRTAYMQNLAVNAVSMSYEVGGVATENYTLEGDTKRWYLHDKCRAIVYEAEYEDATHVRILGVNLASGYTGEVVTQEGDIVADTMPTLRGGLGSTITLTDDSSDTLVSAAGGDTPVWALSSGERFRVLVTKDTVPNSEWEDEIALASTPDGIGGIRKGMVEIALMSSGEYDTWYATTSGGGTKRKTAPLTSTYKTLRLQTVSVDIDLSREGLEELGNFRAYSRSLVYPIPITIGVSALDSDLEMWSDLSNIVWSEGSSPDMLDIDDLKGTAKLVIQVFSDEKNHNICVSGTTGCTADGNKLLKQITCKNLSVSSEAHSTSVGGNATQEFSLIADEIEIFGTGLSPLV